jgi:alanyl-tRNA synthetase
VEIWNIVFSQFNNDGNGNYNELARKNIDTGAGLERLAAISQQVPTDFDADGFLPIITAISQLTTYKYDQNAYFSQDAKQLLINRDFKIIADHVKACTFAIADGAIPSNKERGSVLRRLIRRAMISARRLEIKQNFTMDVVSGVIKAMVSYYPYLKQHQPRISEILNKEEMLFNQTLERGFKLFDEVVSQKQLHIDNVFKLVDTYGFPFEIIAELAKERGLEISEAAYQKKLAEHQNISRANTDVKGLLTQNEHLLNFRETSTFDYEKLVDSAKIIALFDEKFKPITELRGVGWIVFDHTVFYATSGGQEHDRGYIQLHNQKYQVIDVIKGPNGQHFHKVSLHKDVVLAIGDACELHVDSQIRKLTSANHSVEHLIQHALRTIIDKSIRQEGAFKSANKVTFDYHYPHKLSDEQIIKVQDEVNKYIQQNLPVQTKLMHLDEAKQDGAIAWFDDVYRKIKGKLRVVCVGDVSKEICGGTHVANTTDIEQFLIVQIESKGGGS